MVGTSAIQDAARRWIDDVLAGSPPARHAGITIGAVEKDKVVLHLPFKPSNVTVGKIVHGGVIATLIDVAGASASASGLNEDAAGGATESLSIHFLLPPRASTSPRRPSCCGAVADRRSRRSRCAAPTAGSWPRGR